MENNNIIGIIPLGGSASRMKNIPKFLLPCKVNYSLLDNTIDIFKTNNIKRILSGVSKINNTLLETNQCLEKIIVDTKTMAETVFNLVKDTEDNSKLIMIMPDTYFEIKNEINQMNSLLNTHEIVVLLWKIKDYQIGKVGQCKIENNMVTDVIDKDPLCTYPYFWGVIGWNSKLNKHIDPKWETIGNLINKSIELNIKIGYVICDSDYYDCGTYTEYFKMIKNLRFV